MATGERPLKRLIQVLLIVTLGCVIAAAMLIAGGTFWVKNSWELKPERSRGRMPGEIVVARGEFTPPFEIPKKFSKNAILAARENRPFPGDDIFVELAIPRLQIKIEREEYAKLKKDPREYVLSTVTEGETIYTNVAIRLKGSIGSYRDLRDIPSFTVNFDKFAEGQRFHGLKKIHLNSSVQDRSLMEEKISRELCEAAGLPVPRAGNAHVVFNNRPLGLYVLVEGVNKQFLKRYFSDTSGNVYEGKMGTDVTDSMRTNSGDDRTDKSALRALARAAREPDLDERLRALEKTLDVDRFLSFMAMEMILWHWDGYTMHRNNYRIFHDKTQDRMVFFPHGMDQMFGETKKSVLPQQPAGRVAQAVLEVPELRDRYRQRVAEIATNVFLPEEIASRVYEVSKEIQGMLAEIDPSAAAEHPRQADSLRRRVQERAAYLERFMSPPKPAIFDEQGFALLEGWRPRTDLGAATLSQEKSEEGVALLRIATEEGCTASWRTTVILQPGIYRFEARIRTEGVVLDDADRRAGAGLRISRHREGQKNEGDSDWKPIEFEFEVTAEKPEVELICELRGNEGEILYDASSLMLRRI